MKTKTIAEDKTYIDYTRGNFGVRVWIDRCQAIARADSESEWIGRERAYPLPLEDRFREFPIGCSLSPVPAITFEIGRVESDELRKLVRGELSFDTAAPTAEPQ